MEAWLQSMVKQGKLQVSLAKHDKCAQTDSKEEPNPNANPKENKNEEERRKLAGRRILNCLLLRVWRNQSGETKSSLETISNLENQCSEVELQIRTLRAVLMEKEQHRETLEKHIKVQDDLLEKLKKREKLLSNDVRELTHENEELSFRIKRINKMCKQLRIDKHSINKKMRNMLTQHDCVCSWNTELQMEIYTDTAEQEFMCSMFDELKALLNEAEKERLTLIEQSFWILQRCRNLIRRNLLGKPSRSCAAYRICAHIKSFALQLNAFIYFGWNSLFNIFRTLSFLMIFQHWLESRY